MHPFGRWLPLAWRILWHPWTRYLFCWGLLLYVGYRLTEVAWTSYDSKEHPAHTTGHTLIDFGGQWFTGKMLLRGEGHHLYERRHIWNLLNEFWPPDNRRLTSLERDALRLESWRSAAEQDEHAAELLCSYLMPLGATSEIGAVSSLAGALQVEDKVHRVKYGEDKKLKDADMLLYWLVGVGKDELNGEAYESEVIKTNASCVSPLATQNPFGVLSLIKIGQQRSWAPKRIEQASHRIVGGQLYPPIHAFLYVPMALMDPVTAYRVAILLPLVFALIAGWGLVKVTAGGIWWPIGTLLTVAFPHFVDAQALGHNGALIVAILIWGYYYLQKNADIRGGIIWGLVAYKPSWAFMFFVLLVVSRRWKAAFVMGTCGVVQILATLPFVGIHSWIEWRQVIAEAAPGYGIYQNWVNVSRDMFTYPRRALTDWNDAPEFRDVFESRLIGFILIGIVLEITVRLTSLRGRQSKRWTYAAGAFLMLGFWMSCLHITYYDTIFATLPVAILLMTPTHSFVPYFFRRTSLSWKTAKPTLPDAFGRAIEPLPPSPPGTPGGEGRGEGGENPSQNLEVSVGSSPSPPTPLPRSTGGEGRLFAAARLTLPPRNYGLICNPLIVYILPLILWNPWGQAFVNEFARFTGWYFVDIVDVLSRSSTERAARLSRWLDQPLIVPLFAILWLWAGWLWLREKGEGGPPLVNSPAAPAPSPPCPPPA